MSFLEENKAIIRRLFEAVNKRDPASLDELMAPDYVDHALQLHGLEANKQVLTMFLKGFPDWHETIQGIIAEGDKVWVRFKSTGTHAGEFRGLAPTGNKFTETGVLIYRIVDGKIAEGWTVSDLLDFFKQLGVIEYTEKGKKLFPEDAK